MKNNLFQPSFHMLISNFQTITKCCSCHCFEKITAHGLCRLCNFYAVQGMQGHLPDKSFVPLNLKLVESSLEDKLDFLVKSVYRFESFRPKQKEAILHFMGGKDTCIIMPTAFGKSLCYWTPAVLHSGLTVVLEPLIALIHDQMVLVFFGHFCVLLDCTKIIIM